MQVQLTSTLNQLHIIDLVTILVGNLYTIVLFFGVSVVIKNLCLSSYSLINIYIVNIFIFKHKYIILLKIITITNIYSFHSLSYFRSSSSTPSPLLLFSHASLLLFHYTKAINSAFFNIYIL